MRRKERLIIVLLFLLGVFSTKAFSKQPYSYEKNSFIGLGLREDRMSGDYTLGDGAGVSLFGGYRFNDVLALEVSFLTASKHDTGDYVLFLTDGYHISYFTSLSLAAFVIDFKIHPRTERSFKPYAALGLGSYSLLDNNEGFYGLGYLLGFGYDFEYPNWLIDLGLRYHIVEYDSAALNDKRMKLNSSFEENTLSFMLNTGYRF